VSFASVHINGAARNASNGFSFPIMSGYINPQKANMKTGCPTKCRRYSIIWYSIEIFVEIELEKYHHMHYNHSKYIYYPPYASIVPDCVGNFIKNSITKCLISVAQIHPCYQYPNQIGDDPIIWLYVIYIKVIGFCIWSEVDRS